MKPGRSSPATSRGAKRWRAVIAIVAVVIFVALALQFEWLPRIRGFLEALVQWIDRLGAWGPVLFIMIYVLAAVACVPGSILTAGAGALFGFVRGSIYVSIAATAGATAAFLVGRYLARARVAKKVANNPTFAALDHAVADQGWKIVGLVRLSPVFPFVVVNYAFGLTSVKLWEYVLASWVGMIPATLLYVYIGSLAQAGRSSTTPARWLVLGLGLLATLALTIVLTRIARKALDRRIPRASSR